MARTGAHLKIEPFGDKVLGVRLKGDRRQPEPDEFRIMFPGGDVSVTRCTDGASYWIHVRVDRPDHPSADPEGGNARIVDARLDSIGQHASDADVGDFRHPGLYHLAVKVAPVEAAPPAPPPKRPRLTLAPPAKRSPPWRLIASAPDVAGIETMIGEFWPASGYTVDPETLTLLQHGEPSPRGRVVRMKGRLRFEIPARAEVSRG